ncbi:DedA family protein [Nitratifractor sp.]|uniref:DedA family protein n=1 Tax=Nitratifractor sp. TaxID=2268144 RepID=UPI0025E57D17|nr:DedA family protein [Nitratifractor sp.]
MEEILHNLALYGYIILAFYSFGGGMLALAGAGILSALGKMDIGLSILVATVANFVGDTFLFYLAQTNKKEVLKYLRKHRRKIAYTNLLMRKYGWMAVFLQKYIYGVKTLVPIVMGLSRYDFKKFVVLNFFASILWGLVVGLGSYYFSAAVRAWFG